VGKLSQSDLSVIFNATGGALGGIGDALAESDAPPAVVTSSSSPSLPPLNLLNLAVGAGLGYGLAKVAGLPTGPGAILGAVGAYALEAL
jgi:hypothetical protein